MRNILRHSESISICEHISIFRKLSKVVNQQSFPLGENVIFELPVSEFQFENQIKSINGFKKNVENKIEGRAENKKVIWFELESLIIGW